MIRIATYNIRKCVGLDWRRRPERTLRVLAELDADIVAVQEADRRFGDRRAAFDIDALRETTGLRPAPLDGAGPSVGWRGNAILVRDCVAVLGAEALSLPSLEPRGAVIADLETRGLRLRVVGVHLGLRGVDRRRQALRILQALEARADGALEIVVGDLNEWSPRGGCLRTLSRRLRAAPPRLSFHAAAPIAALDRVLTGPGLRTIDVAAHRSNEARRASDHLPVVARLAATRDGRPGAAR